MGVAQLLFQQLSFILVFDLQSTKFNFVEYNAECCKDSNSEGSLVSSLASGGGREPREPSAWNQKGPRYQTILKMAEHIHEWIKKHNYILCLTPSAHN